MRLTRPRIPIDVRLQVVERQLGRSWSILGQSRTERLQLMLNRLFPNGEKYHLDHDPALAFREKVIDDKAMRGGGSGLIIGYKPDANDPNFLIYRTVEDHKRKTNLRGDGAQHPDRVLIKKIRRIEGNGKKKKKYKWPKRKMRGGHLRPARSQVF